MLKRISGSDRGEITGRWRKMHIEKFCNLDFSPNISRIIKSRRMRGRACKMYGRHKKCIQNFSHKT
jgi:hypothetical protein